MENADSQNIHRVPPFYWQAETPLAPHQLRCSRRPHETSTTRPADRFSLVESHSFDRLSHSLHYILCCHVDRLPNPPHDSKPHRLQTTSMAAFRNLRQQLRSSISPPEPKRLNSSMSRSTAAAPRRRRLPPARDLLDHAKSRLQRIRLTRGRTPTRRVVDGEVLARQERDSVAVTRAQHYEQRSRDLEQAAAVLTRMAKIEEARVCWWITTEGS